MPLRCVGSGCADDLELTPVAMAMVNPSELGGRGVPLLRGSIARELWRTSEADEPSENGTAETRNGTTKEASRGTANGAIVESRKNWKK
jgi:hypothetical protein